ncbi:MAG: hypothetical protein Q8R00_01110 [Candidatus Nanoarchaeia archaeon]|nr:hypothetical protein [Candidatus Nanoarchaeia archaeon]
MLKVETSNYLRQTLVGKIKQETNNIQKAIETFCRSNKEFNLFELNDNIIILLKKSKKSKLTLNIGFPFPIDSFNDEDIKFNFERQFEMDIFLRGEEIRTIQRKLLFDKSEEVNEVFDINSMREIISKDFTNTKGLIYIDPYEFIGDSFIGLFFLESFLDKFNIDKVKIFSNSYDHLNSVYNAYPRDNSLICKESKKIFNIIMPDLIDSHWKETLNLIFELKNKNLKCNILIIGRNLHLKINNRKIFVYWYKSEDILLRNKNIQDYMSDLLEPFLDKISYKFGKINNKNKTIYVNPFGSLIKKAIPTYLVLAIYKEFSKSFGEELDFNIIGGYYNRPEHQRWINEFLSITSRIEGKLNISYYSNLFELSKDMQKKKCSLIISADTSISHMANKIGYPNLTIYKTIMWDKESIQSLASDSPLGFCRYTSNQLPIMLEEYDLKDYSELAKQIIDCFKFLIKSEKEKAYLFNNILRNKVEIDSLENYKRISKVFINTDLSWISKFYDPNKIFENVDDTNDKIKKLIEASIKISPLFKMNLIFGGKL